MRWIPWRSLAERAERAERAASADLLDALALDEVEEHLRAIRRAVGVVPVVQALHLAERDVPPNLPSWPTNRRGNQPPPGRFLDARDHRGPW